MRSALDRHRLGFVDLCRRQVGLPDIDFHHLRHFAATTLAGAGIDVRTIAGRLGHANPAITLKIHALFLEAADRDAAAVMGTVTDRVSPRAVEARGLRHPMVNALSFVLIAIALAAGFYYLVHAWYGVLIGLGIAALLTLRIQANHRRRMANGTSAAYGPPTS